MNVVVFLLIVVALIWWGVATLADQVGLPGWLVAVLLIALCVLCIWAWDLSTKRKFLREAHKKIQDRMATVREGLVEGARVLDAAESELEAGTAPLFWDEMDRFPEAIHRCEVAWNEAVDTVRRCETLSAQLFTGHHDLVAPDYSLPATYGQLAKKWDSIKRRSLAQSTFALVFEQRRQADKIADRLRKQDAAIRTAIDNARRAEAAASQAVAIAGQAKTAAKHAHSTAGRAGSTARRAESKANAAMWTKL